MLGFATLLRAATDVGIAACAPEEVAVSLLIISAGVHTVLGMIVDGHPAIVTLGALSTSLSMHIAEVTSAVGSFLGNNGCVSLGTLTTFVVEEVRTVDGWVEAYTVGDWVGVLTDNLMT